MMVSKVVTIATALTLWLWGPGPWVALAQTPATPQPQMAKTDDIAEDMTSDIELTRAAIQVRRQALVTAAMDFNAKEAEAFWPLYRDYRLAMATVNDNYVKLVVAYLNTYENLTDDAATKMLDEAVKIEGARTGVKTQYIPRFRKVLPAKKVARFFQVDNKLDAFVNAELAQLIPLAR